MKKIAIALFLLGGFLGYSQHTKKKIYKKPVSTATVKIEQHTKSTELFSNPIAVETAKTEAAPAEQPDYEKTAEKILKQKGWINNRNSALVRGVEGFVKGVYSANGKIFVMLEISNRSNINYDLKNISFITRPSKKKNKEIDTEEKIFIPIYSNQPNTINKKTTQKMIFVFDKFTIAENKTLNAIINENEGERNLKLEVRPTYILEAKYIN